MRDILSMQVRTGICSGAKYLVINNQWYPLDEDFWDRGSVFDYDQNLGYYLEHLGIDMECFDAAVIDYLRDVYATEMPMSINEATEFVLEGVMEEWL